MSENTGTNNLLKRYLDYKGLDILWKLIKNKFVTIETGTLNNPTIIDGELTNSSITNGILNNPSITNGTLTGSSILGATAVSVKYPNNDTNSESYPVWHYGNLKRVINYTKDDINNLEKKSVVIDDTTINLPKLTLTSNCYDFISDEIDSLYIDYDLTNEITGVTNEYNLEFTAKLNESNDKFCFVFPENMYWGSAGFGSPDPIWANGYSYQISILNNVAKYTMFIKPDDTKRIYYSLKTLSYTNPSESDLNKLQLNETVGKYVKDSKVITNSCSYNFSRSTGKEGIIEFDNTAKNIVNNAFNGTNDTQFKNIKSIILPTKLNVIGESSFANCTELTTIKVPDTVTSVGSKAFYNCINLKSFIRDSISANIPPYLLVVNNTVVACAEAGLTNGRVDIPEGINAIAPYAFYGCRKLTSVTIPDSVTSIGRNAFYGCTGLTSVTIGNNVDNNDSAMIIGRESFEGCSKLTSVTIGNSVTTIGERAFYGCSKLTSVTIPDSVTTIGVYAFQGCTGITSVTIGTGVISIGTSALNGCTGELIMNSNNIINTNYTSSGKPGWLNGTGFTSLIIGDGVTTIGNYAFYNYTSLTSVTIPDSVTKIGDYAFGGCTGTLIIDSNDIVGKDYSTNDTTRRWLTDSVFSTIKIGDNVTKIGDYVFYNYTCITDITIGNKVTTIGRSAFNNSIIKNDTSVTIPDSVTTIGDYAFSNCSSLTSVTIGDSVTKIGYGAFQICSSLTSVTIPDSVTTIGYEAFSGCSNLTSVYISDITAWCNISFSESVSNPLYYANNLYLNNKLVTNLTIPEGVTSIGKYAFSRYSSLTSITIPDSVTTIGASAFRYCDSLTSVTFKTESNTISIGTSAFHDCSNLISVTFSNNVDLSKFNTSSLKSMTNISNIHIDCNIKTSVIDANNNTLCGISLSNVTLHIGKNAQNTRYINNSGGMPVITYHYLNTIAETAFNGCNIKNVILYHIHYLASNIKSAFDGCEGNKLTIKCSIPNASNSNSVNALFYNSDFGTLEISSSVETIGKYAFYSCSNLTSVTIGSGVTTIGDSAFDGCTSLTSITIPDSVTSIGDSAFSDCTSLTSITIPDSVTSIGDSAFWGCGLTSVTIPDNVKTIEGFAFYNCESLKTLTIKSGVESIGYGAFSECSSLTSVTIGDSVNYSDLTTIEVEAFYYCSKLTNLNCYALVPPTLGVDALANTNSKLSIKVPKSSESAYETAPNWNIYKSKISGI